MHGHRHGYRLFLTAVLTASLLLSGCSVLIGHDYVSPNWQDPGIYQAVLKEGTTGEFKMTHAGPGEGLDTVSLDNATWGLVPETEGWTFDHEEVRRTYGEIEAHRGPGPSQRLKHASGSLGSVPLL